WVSHQLPWHVFVRAWRQRTTAPTDGVSSGDESVTYDAGASLPFWYASDGTHHASGVHAGWSNFSKGCTSTSSTTQHCSVSPYNTDQTDSGTVTDLLYYHIGKPDQQSEYS